MTTSKRVERARLYFPGENGAVVTVTPVNGKKFLYKELSEAVGGMIESIRPAVQGHTVWANEEGLLLGLKPNRHTWEAANKRIYLLNGYGENWRIVGRILEVYKTDDLTAVPTTVHGALLWYAAAALVQEASHV
jgi:hypothetical protein